MTVSFLIRHGVACVLGTFAWWYFYSAENIFYPPWLGVIVAAFVITLVVVIISGNELLIFAITGFYFLILFPDSATAFNDLLPVLGGIVAGTALWKIL
ncbi:hypothetical protein Tfer_1509 [Thermincola ferriacetica]|uniref:Uncharacterized protein n=2 Tax=Thermincola TaxID=278993 RepID=D5XCH9_THEPJ|nr:MULTISPECIES: hypothetical protein [Thermincola]ADG81605.1 hypothetical protein TherJR_0738 [Thermincola potens JR]KNZ69896.1 hypothetical protein Tfer_1509 [Thermincola ferriacetica]